MYNSDYQYILSAVQELPFSVGKNTLVDLCVGAQSKKMLSNDTYMELDAYACLERYDKREVMGWTEELIRLGCLTVRSPEGQPHWKLLHLTQKGRDQLANPDLHEQEGVQADKPQDGTKKLIEAFSDQLDKFNEEQRQAIVTPAKNVRCIAGAGAGKTTVLTERIRFLVKNRGVPANEILAITFTRKARKEMQERLAGVRADIFTFNGLCHRILSAAGEEKRIISYGEKIKLFREAVREEGLEMESIVHEYFTRGQRQGALPEELSRRLMHDVYSIIDHFANEDEPIAESGSSALATLLLRIAKRIREKLDERELRDYSQQLEDALKLLRDEPGRIPRYAHVLVDEYQDVNTAQVRLLELLNPEHLFVVGDPRQSIFGWRGSHVDFILDFEADVTVQLTDNYRSTPEIVQTMNRLIKHMQLPDLQAIREGSGMVQLLTYGSEQEELQAVAALLGQRTHEKLFVLARTNSQLEQLSGLLKQANIAHNIRREEDESQASGITLATVHAIKGLEAPAVIVMGCTTKYFPIRVSDHPVIELIKDSSLSAEEEEKRLLYVALSRAKDLLIITAGGTPTYFLDGALGEKKKQRTLETGRNEGVYERLKAWRRTQASETGLPAYCICTDKTLRQLSELMPASLEDLHMVHGMGETRIEKYGHELLDVLRG